MLTRSLGRKPEVEIDIEQHPLAVGDTLLLCSDGLWGFVPEQEIRKAAAGPRSEAAAHNLLELALAAGGHDNIGIEIARLISPPDSPSSTRAAHRFQVDFDRLSGGFPWLGYPGLPGPVAL